MHGACRVSRGQEWRYYVCRKCRTPSVRADDAERVVVDAIKTMTLPPSVIDDARTELARRLDVPQTDLVGTKRERLITRLNRLTQLYGWGELEADDYRRQMTETRAMLAELPDPDRLVAFDRNRTIMVTMAENVEKATRPQLQELVQLLVERVQTKDRSVDPDSVEWTPPARPDFGEVRGYGAPGRIQGRSANVLNRWRWRALDGVARSVGGGHSVAATASGA